MTISYDQLRNPPTPDQAFAELETLLITAGFPATAWQSGGVFRTMLSMAAEVYSALANRASTLATLFLNDTAEGDALTELSDSHYDNQRAAGVRALGRFRVELTDTSSGPYTVGVGEMAANDGEHVFVNDTAFVLNSVTPVVSASFIAIDEGTTFNVENDITWTLATSYVDVEVTNPAIAGTTSWLLRDGTDTEDDDRLRVRNSTKWSTLGKAGSTIDRVVQLALSASTDVTQVYVDDLNPRGAGTVDVYLSGDTTTISSGTLMSISGTIQSAFFGPTGSIGVYAATEYPLCLTASVYHSPGYSEGVVQEAIEDAVTDFISASPVGGSDFSPGPSHLVSVNDLITFMEVVPGVRKVSIYGPSDDFEISVNQKLTLSDQTFIGVSYIKMAK